MKKLYIILILITNLLSCGKNNNDKIKNDLKKTEQLFCSLKRVDKQFIEFDIDTLSNFNQLVDISEEIDCLRYNALLKIETDEKIYKIQPLKLCESIMDYKLRDIIYINTDSITVNYELKYPIDSLKTVLKYHLQNPDNDSNYPVRKRTKLISVNVDNTLEIDETKKLLLNIINKFNQLDIKPNFWFMFEDRGILPKYINN